MLRRRLANPGRVVVGFVYVVIGLVLFLIGLEEALFPLGKTMAEQLTDPAFLGLAEGAAAHWLDYGWVYAFAATIGFGTGHCGTVAHGRRPQGQCCLPAERSGPGGCGSPSPSASPSASGSGACASCSDCRSTI